MFSLIIIICAVIIIGVLLNKNNRLQLATYKKADNNAELKLTIKDMITSGKSDAKLIKYVREQTGLSLVKAKNLVEQTKNNQ